MNPNFLFSLPTSGTIPTRALPGDLLLDPVVGGVVLVVTVLAAGALLWALGREARGTRRPPSSPARPTGRLPGAGPRRLATHPA